MIEAKEIAGIISRIAPVVLAAVPSKRGTTASSLRRAVGLMLGDPNMAHIGTFAIAFRVCLDLARASGATLTSMDAVRVAATAEAPINLGAILTVNAIIRLTLAQDARIIAGLSFASRDDVDRIADAMNDAFDSAGETASDDHDAGTYLAILRLQADVTKHLADRGRVLPRVIDYSNPQTTTAITMAKRAYNDPSRSDEIRLENRIVHPAFVPLTGRMLAT